MHLRVGLLATIEYFKRFAKRLGFVQGFDLPVPYKGADVFAGVVGRRGIEMPAEWALIFFAPLLLSEVRHLRSPACNSNPFY